MSKKLTSKEMIEMEQRGFRIPLPVWLYNLKKEDKIDLTEDRVKDMLKFAVEREYYEKAAILRDFLKNKNKSK